MKVGFTAPDPEMPRTAFWEAFAAAVRRSPRYVAEEARADLLLPAEDVALETNWPRYGNPESAFVRGTRDAELYGAYLRRLLAVRQPLAVVNMLPGMRLSRLFQPLPNTLVADVSLSAEERAGNPRTISMPALPIIVGTPRGGARRVLASFRGALSHPCRAMLDEYQDGERFVCQIVDPANHVRRIDAEAGAVDPAYVDLMAESEFAYVPRGDSLFSYRLLEAVSFGCIPVVMSDGWVLPFDRTIDWNAVAIRMPEMEVRQINRTLAGFGGDRIAEMRDGLARIWARHLCDIDAVVETFLGECEMFLSCG